MEPPAKSYAPEHNLSCSPYHSSILYNNLCNPLCFIMHNLSAIDKDSTLYNTAQRRMRRVRYDLRVLIKRLDDLRSFQSVIPLLLSIIKRCLLTHFHGIYALECKHSSKVCVGTRRFRILRENADPVGVSLLRPTSLDISHIFSEFKKLLSGLGDLLDHSFGWISKRHLLVCVLDAFSPRSSFCCVECDVKNLKKNGCILLMSL